jgi:hypothetical protein
MCTQLSTPLEWGKFFMDLAYTSLGSGLIPDDGQIDRAIFGYSLAPYATILWNIMTSEEQRLYMAHLATEEVPSKHKGESMDL